MTEKEALFARNKVPNMNLLYDKKLQEKQTCKLHT